MAFTICFANSIVGTKIKALKTLFLFFSFIKSSRIGIKNAQLFPVPLLATPIMSLLFKAIGIAFS